MFRKKIIQKILAIDDTNDNLISLRAIIHDVFPDTVMLTALNGAQGLELAIAEDPDVVLLDIVMPGMDGFEVCRRLKNDPNLRDIPVVFLTAQKETKGNRLLSLEAGAEAFLAKPIDEAELTAQIKAMLKIKEASDFKKSENQRLEELVTERTQQLKEELRLNREISKKLSISEERFRVAQEMSPDGFTILNPIRNGKGEIVDFKWIYENQAIARINGTDPKKVIGKRLLDLLPGYGGTSVFEAFVHVANTGHTDILEEIYAGEKVSKPTWLRLVVVSMGEDIAILTHDTSERKKIEDALRESEVHFRTLANSGQALIWTSGIDKKCNYFNQPWLDFRGRRLEQELGDGWVEGVHPDDLHKCIEIYVGAFDRREKFSMDYRIRHASGAYRWIQDDGTPRYNSKNEFIGFIGHCLDISGRKQAEEALRQSEATVRNKLNAIVEPEGDIGTLELTDIIDAQTLQPLLEDFYRVTGMLGAILDLSGKVLVAVGWQDICTKFHRCHPVTLKNCAESDTILTRDVLPGTFRAYRCKNNMWDMVTPLMLGDRHIGNVFIGQFFYEGETPDVELFRKQARRHGFDEAEYLEALERVPHFSQETAQAGMEFYAKLAGIISRLSFSAIQQSRLLAERKRTEEKLRESEARFRKIYEDGANGMVMVSRDFKFLQANKAFCKMTGYREEETKQLTFAQITHPDDIAKDIQNVKKLISGKTNVYRTEKRYIKKEGQIFWAHLTVFPMYNSDGKFLYNVGIIVDTTERKQAELLLAESEERYRNIIEAAPVGIAIDQNRKIVFINPGGLEIIGARTAGQIIGNPVSSIMHPDNLEKSVERIQRLVNGETGLYPVEDKYVRMDGVAIDVEVMATLLTYKNEPAVQVIITDITERKQLREELQQLNIELELKVEQRTASLEAANKELEAFSYSVSHDLRAPLRHINGYVELLNTQYREELDEKARHYLDTVSGASRQMGTLIDDLLQFSRTGRKELSSAETDLNALLQEVLKEMEPVLKERKIKWDIQKLPNVFGDYSLLKLVWANLLDNAIKYTRNQPSAKISVGFKIDAKEFVFCVRDNGVGFDMKYAHKLFGVFQRLHSQAEFEGTGIGLANVQRIIHKHNGRVWAEAKKDIGASFFFSLPIRG